MKDTAILVIDMLEDFLSGALKCERAAKTLPLAKEFLTRARAAGLPVIFCCDAHRKGIDGELPLWGEHAMAGTKGAEIEGELGPEAGDFTVYKRRYSAFFHTELDILLRELGIKRVILFGIQAHICVQHTAADAYFYGYEVYVVPELTEAFTEEKKEGALAYMREMYAAKDFPARAEFPA